ncbi:Regulator of ribonuclease activity A [Paraburkholderia sediminicola]|uniref:Putative 4-hydroxy-4-methyl-2-oxoglutarate aldolase n=1 Tax=Paraburkholderia sediminicola TaxID=458836 RepID=A0A6J5ANU1_9BURK|nr:RraA family protein [Paraburkholderia sediminicola]CAB3676098.1 Regulator of ribonuclease activity A [Paraburkholderia sediminicola]
MKTENTALMQTTPDSSLLRSLESVSFPTLGHFMEDGFADHRLRAMVPNVKVIGRAVTLKLLSPDAIPVNRALSQLKPGDVLVIDMSGNHTHAPVGAVTAYAALDAGARGVIVDGVVTDLIELRSTGLPVFARGTSLLTTKKRDTMSSLFNEPVMCGGVAVRPGDIVLADDNGVLFAEAPTLAAVLDLALASDRAEPAILARLKAKAPLHEVLQCAMS